MRLSPTCAHQEAPCCTRHSAQVARGRCSSGSDAPSLTTSSCARPEHQVEEAQRIEQRLRGMPEGIEHDLAGDLRGARTVGVAAHAVDDDEQRRMLGHGGGDPVLVLLAPAQEADVGVLNPQE